MPLKIFIVGAGITGLSAAISLARQGHNVELFEKSAFSNEVGAALHFAPNATKILREHLGIDLEEMQPVVMRGMTALDLEMKTIPHLSWDVQERQRRIGITEKEILVHRVDAHSCLRRHALAFPNVKLQLSAPCKDINTREGRLVLEDGSIHQADLIIGADGVHSRTVLAVAPDLSPMRSGTNIFRCLIPVEKVEAISSTLELLGSTSYLDTHLNFWDFGRGLRILVMYPCRRSTLLNVALIYPAELNTKATLNDNAWQARSTAEEVIDIFGDFPKGLVDMIATATDVKHWAFASRDPAPTFVEGKLVLAGDAAHPIAPTYGAGAAQGVEDAAVLGTLLDASVTLEQLPDRLALYNKLRWERAVTVQAGSELLPPEMRPAFLKQFIPDGKLPPDLVDYIWGVDVVAQAKACLD